MIKVEYVYILTNLEYEGLVKIGKTTIHPQVRAYQMNSLSSSIGKFIVEWYMEVPDCHEAEKKIKKEFKEYWFQKEFYSVPLGLIISKSQKIISNYFNITNPNTYLRKQHIEIEIELEILKLQIALEQEPLNRKPKIYNNL